MAVTEDWSVVSRSDASSLSLTGHYLIRTNVVHKSEQIKRCEILSLGQVRQACCHPLRC
jgi:hypothetical protein